jgi:hypothetical protein
MTCPKRNPFESSLDLHVPTSGYVDAHSQLETIKYKEGLCQNVT